MKTTSPHWLTSGNHLDNENYYRQVLQGNCLSGRVIKGLYGMLLHWPNSENLPSQEQAGGSAPPTRYLPGSGAQKAGS